jgi:hypothetical protein
MILKKKYIERNMKAEEECSFKPVINERSRYLARDRGSFSSKTEKLKLLRDQKIRNLQELYRLQEEKRFEEEWTFKPEICPNSVKLL